MKPRELSGPHPSFAHYPLPPVCFPSLSETQNFFFSFLFLFKKVLRVDLSGHSSPRPLPWPPILETLKMEIAPC